MTITLHHPNSNNDNSNNSNAGFAANGESIGNAGVSGNKPVFVSGNNQHEKTWLDTYRANNFPNLTTSVLGAGPYYYNHPTMDPPGAGNDTGWGGNPQPTLNDICDTFSFPYVDLTQSDPVRQAFVIIYVIVIVLSLFGNWMVIWTVIRNKHMRTVTNYYIVNLAVSDFLVAVFVMPLKLLEYTAPCSWHIFNGDAMCPFMSFVLPVFVFASVLTLVAISMERYYAIVYPLSAMKVHSKSRTRKILACTWIIPIICASPYLFYKSYPFVIFSDLGSISRQICTDRFDEIDVALYGAEGKNSGRFRKGFFFFLFIAIYLVPLMVILGTCVRIAMRLLKPMVEKQESVQGQRITRKREENKRRVARMIVVVAVAFIVAWSPFYLVTFISQVQTKSFLRKSNYVFVMLAVHLVGFINSCINPFIYNFMSDKFRKSFTQIVLSMCCLCARIPFLRKLYAARTRAAFNRNGSEYDHEYSMGEFSRAPTQHSPLDKEPASGSRGMMARCRYDSSGGPSTPTIVRLAAMSSQSSHDGCEVVSVSSPIDLPNGSAGGQQFMVRGSSRGRASASSSSSTSSAVGGNRGTGTAHIDGCQHKDLGRREEGACSGGGGHLDKVSALEAVVGLSELCSQNDLELDTDLYDQPTSNLLTHSQKKL